MSNDCFTLQTAAFQSCYFRKSHQEAEMSESFERVRVLWPDHLGLARGKYVPVQWCEPFWAKLAGTYLPLASPR